MSIHEHARSSAQATTPTPVVKHESTAAVAAMDRPQARPGVDFARIPVRHSGGDIAKHEDASPVTGPMPVAATKVMQDKEADDQDAATQDPGSMGTEQPKDKDESMRRESAAAVKTTAMPVHTVLRPGQTAKTDIGAPPMEAMDRAHAQIVAPGGTPTTGNSSNDCLPSTASAALVWNVVDDPPNNWAVSVTSLTLAGQVNVQNWPSDPTNMVVPNTPNPVVGGNINNTAGSSNYWQAAIDDMADYHTVGGGAGPNWHSTGASSAHEWAHWNTDYVVDSVGSAAGGNWPRANADLDALREPKSRSASAAAARTALQPRVDARLATWRSRTITRWNAIPDSPGVAGSTGYDAGARVLLGLITSVRAFATAQGWTGAPASPPRAPNGPGRNPNPPP